MDGKVVAVTGCTSGTGRICAKVCAQQGAKVLMLNRSSARADEALAALKQEVPGADITLVPCDLMSFEKVKQTAQELKKTLGSSGLDVLCNNAGIMATKDEATVDGCDTQMQTNHLSHFLLTAEVWPLLTKAAELRGEARVVNHSSGARKMTSGGLKQEYFEKKGGQLGGDALGMMPFSGARWDRYAQTKLANLGFTLALRDKAPAESKVKALCAEPGLSSTNLQVTSSADGGMGGGFTTMLMNRMSQSAEDGTMPLLSCCCKADVNSGDFFLPEGMMTGKAVIGKPEPEEKLVPPEKRTMLWDTSLATTGAKYPF